MLLALVGTVMPWQEAQPRPYPEAHAAAMVSGVVASASAERLTLLDGQTQAGLTLALTADTQLWWGAQPLAATVRYAQRRGEPVALAVWALAARTRQLLPTRTAAAAAESAYAQANRLIEAARVREALPCLNQAVRLHPGFLQAYGRRAYVYATLATSDAVQQTYRQRALADYTKAIDEGGKHGLSAAVWYNNRGVLYRQLQQEQRALEDFTAALHLEPGYVVALQNRAHLRRALGDWQGALEDLTRMIALEPQVGKWYCQRGAIRLRQGSEGPARDDFQRCVALDPSQRERYPEAAERWRGDAHERR
jgi:tetratricopeptide (TPR) repeat protein